jgi:hypothetical protein
LTSSPPWKGEDSSRDLRSRCRFAVHSRALVRKKAPRAATACPAAVPCWVTVCCPLGSRGHVKATALYRYFVRSMPYALSPRLKTETSTRRHW